MSRKAGDPAFGALRRAASALWAALLLCTAVPAGAAGPYGGTVRQLLLDPSGTSLRWAATDRGLFRWLGDGWQRVEALGHAALTGVFEGWSRVLVATAEGAVFASGDGGDSWAPAGEGLAGRYGRVPREILCLAGDPAERDRVYLGSAGQGLFVSDDAGVSWRLLAEGLEDAPPPAFHATAVLPAEGARPLLMGTAGAGLFARRDGRWKPAGKGLPENLKVQALAAAPGAPESVALGTRGHGLWRSDDGGGSWRRLRKGAFGVVGAVAVDAAGEILAHFPEEGLVRAVGGKAGRPKHLSAARVEGLVAAGGRWFAALAHDGVRELAPDGTPGAWRNRGLDATQVLSLAAGAAPGALWCGDANGVFHRGAATSQWQPRDQGLLGAPANRLLWFGGALYLGSGGQGVFRWDPQARAWQARSKGLGTANTIFSLVADAGGDRLYVGTEGGVLCSADAGGSWQRCPGLPPARQWRVAASRTRSGRVWAAGNGRLYRSDDRGETWQALDLDLAAEPVALATAGEGAGERLWVLEARRLFPVAAGAAGPEAFRAPDGDRATALLPGPEGLWVGTAAGLWLVADGAPRRVWDGAGVLALLRRDDQLWAGTDGAGARLFRLR